MIRRPCMILRCMALFFEVLFVFDVLFDVHFLNHGARLGCPGGNGDGGFFVLGTSKFLAPCRRGGSRFRMLFRRRVSIFMFLVQWLGERSSRENRLILRKRGG